MYIHTHDGHRRALAECYEQKIKCSTPHWWVTSAQSQTHLLALILAGSGNGR